MTYKTSRIMEFSDTDQAGIVHFSKFFLFMEAAEHEYLRSRGTGVMTEHDGRKISFPRISASCDYISPARFEDQLTITVRVIRVGEKSVTYGFSFRRDDVLLARGRITTVCCLTEAGKPLRSIAIPPSIAARIGPADEPSDAEGQPPAEDL